MGDNINNLPTDNYPISVGEKQLVERYFGTIKEEEKDVYEEYKLPVVIIGIFIFLNVPIVNNIINNLSGDNQFKSSMFKAVIAGLLIYSIVKLKVI
jgi:hypothetical protein